ncbi:hypothetical protein AALP_AA1G164800 [Arabis alpina]|uniref:Uncharacterized protein n=1 Tax=Arabis alpina TaxID=50452 RepID=A0A087HNM6_ARAAL|nr:hypothetical protein AALP_AA1G164800 [Arabis alpina]
MDEKLRTVGSLFIDLSKFGPRSHLVHFEEGTDLHFPREGFITVAPLGALSHIDKDCQDYYREWLPKIANQSYSSSL